MAHRVCWHCSVKSHMTVIPGSGRMFATASTVNGREIYRKQAAFMCDECHHMSIGEQTDSLIPAGGPTGVEGYLSKQEDIHWLPERGTQKEFPDVPGHIAAAASEATLCLSLGAYRAVGALTRAVIEATAKANSITTGTLWAKIDAMYEAHLIREHVRDAAHEVRHFGNDMAHGDFVQAVTEEEATEAVELMAEVLNEVFQSKAKVERVRAARLAKQAQKEA